MSGPNFNVTTQQPQTINPSIKQIYNNAQMPLTLAADGVMRFKAELGVKYILHPGVILPRLEIPKFTNPALPETIEFTAAVQGQAIPVIGDSTPHIWGRNINAIIFRNITFVNVTPQTTKLFDLVGGTALSGLILQNSPLLNFKEIGNVVDIGLNMQNIPLLNYERGLTSRNTSASFLSNFTGGRIANLAAVPTQSSALCFMGVQSTIGASISNIELDAADSVFCIDSVAPGTVDIIGNSFDGVSDFFAPPISNSITAFADASITINTFTDSAVNPGVDTSCNVTSPTDLIRGQVIEITDEVAYDGTHTVVRVADDQLSFDINVAFSTGGPGTLAQTRATSIAHKLVRDQTNTISGTTNYNGTTQVLQIVDNDNFIIPVAFVATETGTVDATSKNQTSIGITAVLNGEATDSRAIGFGEMNNNATVTTIAAASTYQAINVSGIVENIVSERFTLTDATAGVFTYNGKKTFIGTIVATPSAIKSGATEVYRFTTSVNGAIPVFASAFFAPMGIVNTIVSTTVVKPVTLNTGDTVQIMVAGDGTDDDLTITDFVISMSLGG